MKTDPHILPLGDVNIVMGDIIEELKLRDDMLVAHGVNTCNQHSGGIALALDKLTGGLLTEQGQYSIPKLRSGYAVEWKGNTIYNAYSQLNPGADATYGSVFWAYEDIFFSNAENYSELNTFLIGGGIGGLEVGKVYDIITYLHSKHHMFETVNIWMDETTYNKLILQLAQLYGGVSHVERTFWGQQNSDIS